MSERLSFSGLDSPIRETDILEACDEFLNNNSKATRHQRHHANPVQSPVRNNLSVSIQLYDYPCNVLSLLSLVRTISR